jgi:biopolymer transport protein ExbD
VDNQAEHSTPLKIYLLADGTCKVRFKTMACQDVPTYMRDVLKVSDTVQFSLIARGKPSYEAFTSLFEALGHAGFKGKMGIVDLTDMKE